MYRLLISLPLLIAVFTATTLAQTEARITTVRLGEGAAPSSITVNVLCEGQPQYDISRQQWSLFDNGTPVQDFSIDATPSAMVRYPFSVMMVLDRSGSMAGGPIDTAKLAAADLIHYMDSTQDEVGLLAFSTTPQLLQGITASPSALLAQVPYINATGATAMWDACYAGLAELIVNGTLQRRSMLLLSDGADNSSIRTPAEVIAQANRNGIRIFTIGLGGSVNRTELELLSTLTGGRYFHSATASQLQQLFVDIASIIGRDYDEFRISYTSPHPDVERHELTVQAISCNTTVSGTRTALAVRPNSAGRTPLAQGFALRLDNSIPNPVSTRAIIPYGIEGNASPRSVTMDVFDVLGRRVATLVNSTLAAGNYTAELSAQALPRGMYIVRLSSAELQTSRMLYISK